MDVSRVRLYAALVALIVVPLYALDLGGWLFLTNDEARFPAMARDILARGHWLVPEIAGTPMLNKPPLHAWLIALASLPGGVVNTRTAAVPSVLAGLGVALVTGALGVRLFGPAVGVTAGLVAATTVGLFSLAHVPLPDATLTLGITGALYAFALAELDRRRGALTAFYVITGLAFLAKGPVGLLPLPIALAFVLVSHGRGGARGLVSIPGLLVLACLVLPWPLLALHAGGHGFVDTVLVGDFQSTYFGGSGRLWPRLAQPFRLAVEHLLPWVLLLPLGIWAALREPDPGVARSLRLPLVWLVTAFVLIAISERQRWRYYLPLVPPAALLVGSWYHRLSRRHVAVVGAGVCLAVVVALGVGGRYEARARQRATAVSDVVNALNAAPAPAFALDSPDIVFDFYAEHPVVPITSYSQFAQVTGPAYLITSERLARTVPTSIDTRALARVNGRTFVLLRRS